MEVIALKDFVSTVYGNVSAGQKLDVPDGLAKRYQEHGLATLAATYETKVIPEIPTVPGEGAPSSSSPAGQAPTRKTRRRRKQTDPS